MHESSTRRRPNRSKLRRRSGRRNQDALPAAIFHSCHDYLAPDIPAWLRLLHGVMHGSGRNRLNASTKICPRARSGDRYKTPAEMTGWSGPVRAQSCACASADQSDQRRGIPIGKPLSPYVVGRQISPGTNHSTRLGAIIAACSAYRFESLDIAGWGLAGRAGAKSKPLLFLRMKKIVWLAFGEVVVDEPTRSAPVLRCRSVWWART